ncbi:Uncharacterised protein [uncultured archaeon]|nr:Uncharacterised protein [uncultured archaeon]
MDIFNIKDFEKRIEPRKKEIYELKRGFVDCLAVTETLKFYVDDDEKEKARDIVKRISMLKLENLHDSVCVVRIRDVLSKHSLGDLVDFPQLKGELNHKIGTREYALDRGILSGREITELERVRLTTELKDFKAQLEHLTCAETEVEQVLESMMANSENYFYPDHRCWQVKLKPGLLKDSNIIGPTTEGDICEVCPHRQKCSFAGAPLK